MGLVGPILACDQRKRRRGSDSSRSEPNIGPTLARQVGEGASLRWFALVRGVIRRGQMADAGLRWGYRHIKRRPEKTGPQLNSSLSLKGADLQCRKCHD